MIRDVIIYIVLIARIVIAVRLLQLASRTARSLYWLAGVFLINAGYYSLNLGPFSTDKFFSHLSYTLGLTIAQLLVVTFVHTAFYQGRKSPYVLFLSASLIVGIVDTVLALLYGPVVTLISLMVGVNWGWHAVVAYRAYQPIADEELVEDWIKARYKMMIAYCVMLAMTGLILIGYFQSETMLAIQVLVGLFALIGVVLQFLVWVMPSRLRQFLNRNYQTETAPVDETW